MPKPLFITTSWDDGNPADLRVAEMLARHGLTGTFYVPRAIETGVMSTQQLRELGQRFEIGAHTLNHVFLTDVDLLKATDEIVGSKKWVEEVTGTPCPMFCPPAGRYNPQHLPIFKKSGYAGIRTVEFMSFDLPRSHRSGLLEMPTTMQAFPQPVRNYLKNLAKRRAWGNLWRYVVHGRSRDWVVLARRLLARAGEEGGVFHLWGHSWELEQTAQWARLDQVLQLLGEVTSRHDATCLTNGQLCHHVLAGSSAAAAAGSTGAAAAIGQVGNGRSEPSDAAVVS
jgi:hypothetical protein